MRERSPSDNRAVTHTLTPPAAANAQSAHACAFKACPVCGAGLPRERDPKARRLLSPPSGDLTTRGCPVSPVEQSTGISGPDPQTNEMQGHGISFCEHCGAELKPQITRRGHPKRYCSDACRAKAWRRRTEVGRVGHERRRPPGFERSSG